MLSRKDRELIEAACAAIARRYRNDWQEVGAALRTRDGRIVTGVNIDAYLGRMAVCAEAIAIGRSITETGDAGIDTIVAVRHPEPTEADPLHGGQHGARPKNSESAPFRYYQLFLLLSLSKEKIPAWHEK